MRKTWRSVLWGQGFLTSALFLQILCLTGCGPKVSTYEEIERFKQSGAVTLGAEVVSPQGGKTHVGSYRVVSGDILEFQLPSALRVISSDLSEWLSPAWGHREVEPYLIRVTESGTITLPIIETMYVSGKTLAEIEALVIEAYYPKYVVNRPMVVCQVKEYKNEHERVFAVMGLVKRANAFPYPPDVQYNLMEALSFAGGLDMVADPKYLKIYRQGADGEVVSATFAIDGKSMTEAAQVMVRPGDAIYVDHTLRTRANQFLSSVFHITVGANARYDDY